MVSERSQLPQFDRHFFEADQTFTCIGSGALGGKAAGLNLVREGILTRLSQDDFPGIDINIPTLTVLTTDLFDSFMKRNDLYGIALSDSPDARIALAFQKGELPAEFVGDLRALITSVHTPLAIRSSSLLEDALAHPFAGVYGTKMIPNNQADTDARFHKLTEAIKFVFASTFFQQPKSYARSIKQDLKAEKMAVIIQEVVGTRRDDRFYPAISGVARSYSYYPSGHATPEDGVVNLALGLGKQIVDGGISWTYSPAYPKAPPPYAGVGDMLKNSQTQFWAVHMGLPPMPDPIRETEYLVRCSLPVAEKDDCLDHLVSTFDARSERFRPGLHGAGPRLLDFAPILSIGTIPLNDLIRSLLDLAEETLETAVEIEFAVELPRGKKRKPRFGFLQARPMMVAGEAVTVAEEELHGPAVLLSSDRVLGNGTRHDIYDIVYLKPDVFEARFTDRMAAELDGVNRALENAGRPYLLIGFGRWGSSDPWLGVPVDWGQISGARAIVEATLPQMTPDLSQGSHFFHNLISFDVLYMSVRHMSNFSIQWDWLDKQPTTTETEFVRHVHLSKPLDMKVDGRNGRGVILYAR